MQTILKFIKRNAPVFFLGLVILGIFLIIILANPTTRSNIPAGFKRVEEGIFKDREPKVPTEVPPTEPEPEKPIEYANPIPTPDNKGKPYFYGEYDPNLRDVQGYPTPPQLGSTPIGRNYSAEDKGVLKQIELEEYNRRTTPTEISYTEQGFSPEDANGYTGTPIVWTNKSTADIKIVEAVPRHEALKNGITIKPGESYSFRPTIDTMFTYVDANSGKMGKVLIYDATKPLIPDFEP